MFTLNDQSSSGGARHASDEPQGLSEDLAQDEPLEPRSVGDDAAAAARPSKEAPHPASRYDAGTGQGTLFRMPQGDVIEHPVLDGATEGRAAQRATENPFRGHRDPAMGEWNYVHPHDHEDEVAYEPERRREREAEEAAHANDPEPRHWYKYDPFREERNREKAEARAHEAHEEHEGREEG
ncbi:hypothetical protein ACXR2T_09410 [Leucobacter sp. HY1910]